MNFSQAVPLYQRQKYQEGSRLAPARDSRNNSFLWKKAAVESKQQNDFGQAIQKVSREVSKQRRRIVGGFVRTSQTVTMFPFRIYNPPKSSNSILQIRGGLIGYRPKFDNGRFSGDGTGVAAYMFGNYELPLFACGTDGGNLDGNNGLAYAYRFDSPPYDFNAPPTANNGTRLVTLDPAGNPTLICDNAPGTANTNFCQIKVPPVGSGQIGAIFWIQIQEDLANGPYTQLYGQVVQQAVTGFVPPWPGSNTPPNFSILGTQNYFIIGSVWYSSAGATPTIGQMLTQNLMGRYTPLQPNPHNANANLNFVYPIPMIDRGFWKTNNLSGQIFYPGDLVGDNVNKTITGFGIVNTRWIFLNNGLGPQTSTSLTNPQWLPHSIYPTEGF